MQTLTGQIRGAVPLGETGAKMANLVDPNLKNTSGRTCHKVNTRFGSLVQKIGIDL